MFPTWRLGRILDLRWMERAFCPQASILVPKSISKVTKRGPVNCACIANVFQAIALGTRLEAGGMGLWTGYRHSFAKESRYVRAAPKTAVSTGSCVFRNEL